MMPKIPSKYLEPSCGNFARGMVGLGALVAGIYHGISDSQGVPMDPTLESALIYGPSLVAGGASLSMVNEMSEDVVDQMIDMAPSENRPGMQNSRGCAEGCYKVFGVGGAMVGVGLVNGLGYWIGGAIGNSLK